MSITFHATRADGTPIKLDIHDPASLNFASANARVFLAFLGVVPGDDLAGEIKLPEARRAVIRTRATFDRRVGKFTRAATDTRSPGRARLTQAGIGPEYFVRRLDAFERFLDTVVAKGAVSICWG